MGAPGTRRDQVTKLIAGELDVIVTTDVIGHGVNLPVDAVWFAETTKFDGIGRRKLHVWEMAQIAGRAGRGPGNDGTAGIYVSEMPGLDANEDEVAGVAAASGAAPRSEGVEARHASHDGLSIGHVPFGPKLSGLGVRDAAELGVALRHWRQLAAAQSGAGGVLVPMQVDTLVGKWQRVGEVCEKSTTVLTRSWGLDPAVVWSLMMLPVDAGAFSFPDIVRAALHRKSLRARVGAGYHRDLLGAGARAKELRDIQAAVVAFGDGFGWGEHLDAHRAPRGGHRDPVRPSVRGQHGGNRNQEEGKASSSEAGGLRELRVPVHTLVHRVRSVPSGAALAVTRSPSVVSGPFLPTMPPLLLGKTGLDRDEFVALLGGRLRRW